MGEFWCEWCGAYIELGTSVIDVIENHRGNCLAWQEHPYYGNEDEK
jgi:hypothetical protein